MTHPTIKEFHIREAKIRLDRKTLERIVLEYAMQQVGFFPEATKAEIRFTDAIEGSPPYKVGTECVVGLSEDQMLIPKVESAEMIAIDTSTEAVERLLEDLTPGPWWVCKYDAGDKSWYDHNGPCPSIQAPEDQDCAIVHWDGFKQKYWSACNGNQKQIEANASFIAAARDLVPALLKERDDLRAQLTEMRAEKERLGREVNTARYGQPDFSWQLHKEALAEARARIDELEAFITDFASAKFESLPQPYIRHPADEPDPVTDAMTVLAWQEDAKGLLKGETK